MKNLNQTELFSLQQKEAKLEGFVCFATAQAYKADDEPTAHFDKVLYQLEIYLGNTPGIYDWLHLYFAAQCGQEILKHELAQIERAETPRKETETITLEFTQEEIENLRHLVLNELKDGQKNHKAKTLKHLRDLARKEKYKFYNELFDLREKLSH